MAFTKTTASGFGFDVQDAYHRVENVQLLGKNKLFFHVRFYAGTDNPSFATTGFECPYDLEGPNPIKQAYQFLKTLPEFSDAVDC
jgi:hypothetical protein